MATELFSYACREYDEELESYGLGPGRASRQHVTSIHPMTIAGAPTSRDRESSSTINMVYFYLRTILWQNLYYNGFLLGVSFGNTS